ncbi:MAG: lectin [Vicinamibacterales bacterium]
MKTMRLILAALTIAVGPGSYLLFAQQPPAPAQPQPMTFFVTSAGKGAGANLGGLAGADAHCQALATAVGRGAPVVWHAYLSTQGAGAVSARDRIGSGPWHNARGQVIAADLGVLHGDTIDQARIGNPLGKQLALTEKGELVNGVGDKPNTHDILTGSTADGRAFTDSADHTCNNWTSSTTGTAQLGHSDKQGGGNSSWNASHPSRGCSQDNLVATGGAGLFYCFAVK